MSLTDEQIRELLYQAIVELEFVQSVENCTSEMCASARGAAIVRRGMKLLGVADLSAERLKDAPRKVQP